MTFALSPFQLREALRLSEGKRRIFCYMAFQDEVETRPLIEELLKREVRVLLPKTNPGSKEITAHRVTSLDDLHPGAYGILEPPVAVEGESTASVPKGEIDLFFIPGTAFDEAGNRKGRGLGCFDRYLAGAKGMRVGFCRERDLVAELRPNSWDVPMNYILTEKRLLTCDSKNDAQ